MMNIELNDTEERILAEALESVLINLRDEISHTDGHDYREFLKERKEVLITLRKKLH